MAAAADAHVLGQRDLGGHDQGQLDRVSFSQLEIGVEECSAAAHVLGKAVAFAVEARQANYHGQLEIEAVR